MKKIVKIKDVNDMIYGHVLDKHVLDRKEKRQQSGFTLIEIMIAVAIFAVVMSAAYSGLNGFLNLSEATKKNIARQQEIIAAMNYLTNDFRYIVDRPVRNSFGDFEPPFTTEGLQQAGAFVEMTTLRPDFLYEDAALPQRVTWKVIDGRLIREHWLVVDQVSESESIQVGVLNTIRSVSVDIVENKNNTISGGGSVIKLDRKFPNGETIPDIPKAVELVIEFEDGQKLTRFIEVIAVNRI